jgi:hypothetical protein
VILRFAFLKAFNLKVDWHTGQLSEQWGIKIKQLDEAKQILRELQIKALKTHGFLREREAIYLKWQSFTQQWSTATHKTCDHLTKDTLPVEYQNHAHIFNQMLAVHFLPNQAENFTITLKPDALDHLDCKIYPLNKRETEVTWSKIKEGLKKGQLKEGPSPYQSPIFFIAKKEGEDLRMVMDY